MSVDASAPLRIGDVARLAGTTPRTIRYYEEIGLLPASGGREPGAHRTYSQADVDRLIEVMRLRTLLGVSLDGLKELVEAEDNREALRREWHEGVPDPVRRSAPVASFSLGRSIETPAPTTEIPARIQSAVCMLVMNGSSWVLVRPEARPEKILNNTSVGTAAVMIASTKAIERIAPVFCSIVRAPAAMPRRSVGTVPIIAAVLGELNMPEPTPTRKR